MGDPPLYELVGVRLDLDGTTVLDGIDLTIAAEGITVVVGPSGAGKSMLLRLLNRLEVVTEGEVRVRGEPVDDLDPLTLRRRVGMVFQRPAPFPGTVRENLLVADPAAGDDDLVEALRDARLGAEFLDRSADDLSGGEAQRMCLARTLLTRPEALLMDEPTSALDQDARLGLERTARRLADGGRPVVWVTHDLDQAGRLADALVVLVDGHVAEGPERDRFVAGAPQDGDETDETAGATVERDATDEAAGETAHRDATDETDEESGGLRDGDPPDAGDTRG